MQLNKLYVYEVDSRTVRAVISCDTMDECTSIAVQMYGDVVGWKWKDTMTGLVEIDDPIQIP